MKKISIEKIRFSTPYVEKFGADLSLDPTPRPLPGIFSARVDAGPVSNPTLRLLSKSLTRELDLEVESESEKKHASGLLSGATPARNIAEDLCSYATNYGGHQFGNWAGQLGDGRALCLGEWKNSLGESFEIQLKGAGKTPFSRSADGRAVLRSSIREYLASESMHALSVPTTRALSLVTTGDQTVRDILYNGNPRWEPTAVVARVAPSFLRFGHFEMISVWSQQGLGKPESLKDVFLYCAERYFPSRLAVSGSESGTHSTIDLPKSVLLVFEEICVRTARLITDWMRVGFTHGVMNTDNMSILGLTIDYGPFGFLESFDPRFTPNTTDLPGRRYAFARQPRIAAWNLERLAEALYPLVGETAGFEAALAKYFSEFQVSYQEMRAKKLGLKSESAQLVEQLDEQLVTTRPDHTIFYRELIQFVRAVHSSSAIQNKQRIVEVVDQWLSKDCVKKIYGETSVTLAGLKTWLITYAESLIEQNDFQFSIECMRTQNPKYILRNYQVFEAIEAAETHGDYSKVLRLEQCLASPYEDNPEFEDLYQPMPSWAEGKPGCSMLSCSS